MKFLKLLWLLLIISGILTSSCNARQIEVTPSSMQIALTATPSSLPQPPQKAQSSPFVETETPQVTQNKIKEVCPDFSSGEPLSGVAIMTGIFNAKSNPYPDFYLLDLRNMQKISLPQIPDPSTISNESYVVSPDQKKLAYSAILRESGNARLLIIDSNGKTLVDLINEYGPDSWYSVGQWTDNNHVKIWTGKGNYLVLNPFTQQERQILTPDYPELSDYEKERWLAYSSDLNYVVYAKNARESIFWDIAKKKVITRFENTIPYGDIPRWAPDDQKFILDLSLTKDNLYIGEIDELFMVDKVGKTTQLTHLNDYYYSPEVDITRYRWSSDSRHIAFWYSTDVLLPEERKYRLDVFDLDSGQTIEYCITDKMRKYEGMLYPPIWSPDGNQFLVRGYIGDVKDLDEFNVYLVDISKNYVVQVTQNAIPVGWMQSEP